MNPTSRLMAYIKQINDRTSYDIALNPAALFLRIGIHSIIELKEDI